MSILERLINNLKRNEILFIRAMYKINEQKSSLKRLRLFNIIYDGKFKNNEEVAKTLGYLKVDSAFCHLKKRLKDDILNFLILASFYNEKSYENIDEIQIREQILKSKILLSRGLEEEAITLLKKVSIQAERFEFPEMRLAALDVLRSHSIKNHRIENYNIYNKKLNRSLEAYTKILNAKELYQCTKSANGINYNIVEKYSIEELEKLNNNGNRAKSQKVQYWNKMTLFHKYIQGYNYLNAHDLINEIILSIEQIDGLNEQEFKANAYIKQSQTLIYLSNYQDAIISANKALSMLTKSTKRYLEALKVLFFACYRARENQQADVVCQEAIKETWDDHTTNSWWLFSLAALKFSQGDFSEVYRLINDIRHLRKNGTMWPLGLKLLELKNVLELHDFDLFEFKLENFRKKLIYMGIDPQQRIKQIYYLFRILLKYNFNYEKTITSEKHRIFLLNSSKPHYRWDPMGYEIINFVDWLSNKANTSN